MESQVVLLGTGYSPFGLRVKMALEEKGIEYDYKEEDLSHKSPLLLNSNPIHKKIPVLIHNGRPICESLIILQYIDEVWKSTSPPLSDDPYQRANARFWADFIDKKVYDSGWRIWRSKGEAQEAAKKELIQCLKLLEAELGDKLYFGGESFGYVDVVLMSFSCWFYTFETYGNFSIEEECSKVVTWVKRCRGRESMHKVLPHPHKVYDAVVAYSKKFLTE